MEEENEEPEGVFNKSADKIPRKDEAWSDTNLTKDYTDRTEPFTRLRCRNCNTTYFEVMAISDYETSARCAYCGMWYIVHTG